MSKVYVVQVPNRVHKDRDGNVTGVTPLFDLFPAEAYGEIIVMLPEGNHSFVPVQLVSMLEKHLIDFTDEDYLIPIGDPVACMIAGIIAVKHNNGKINVLKWDKKYRQYIEVSVTI